jgi:hypothetical protein
MTPIAYAPFTSKRYSSPRARARANYGLYQQLKTECRCLDWAVTLLFYTALHLADAYLCEQDPFYRPGDHGVRDSAIGTKLRGIYEEYGVLYTCSRWARYYAEKPLPTLAQLQAIEDCEFAHIVTELGKLGVRLSE